MALAALHRRAQAAGGVAPAWDSLAGAVQTHLDLVLRTVAFPPPRGS